MTGAVRHTSISLPEDLMNTGLRIARERRRNFSNYIADLIASDAERMAAHLSKSGGQDQVTPSEAGKK